MSANGDPNTPQITGQNDPPHPSSPYVAEYRVDKGRLSSILPVAERAKPGDNPTKTKGKSAFFVAILPENPWETRVK